MTWTSTCPQRTSLSETTRGVSWAEFVWAPAHLRSHPHDTTSSLLFAAPIGSVSSMEVNVDLLDQMELIDISDQDGLDVFFSSVGEDGVLTSPLPGIATPGTTRGNKKCNCTSNSVFVWLSVQGNNNNNEEAISNGLFRHVIEGLDAKSRISSTSSNSSSDSQTTSANGGDTPLVASDDEETHSNTLKRRSASSETEKVKCQNPSALS